MTVTYLSSFLFSVTYNNIPGGNSCSCRNSSSWFWKDSLISLTNVESSLPQSKLFNTILYWNKKIENLDFLNNH